MNIKRITGGKTTKKKKFNYIDENNKVITDKEVIERINKLVIPPAYKEVKIADTPKNYLQATGIDDKGRKQYIYRPSFVEKRAKGKYCQLKHFGQMIGQIRRDIRQNMLSDKPIQSKEKMMSLILYLLDTCHFRIGNIHYYNQHKTHGVSTLLISHLTFKPKELDIEFVGKKSVINKCSVKDPLTIKLIKELVKIAKKIKSPFVFNYNDNGKNRLIRPDEINTFLSKYHPDIILKMYRTWSANQVFLEEMIKRQKEFKLLDKSLANKNNHKNPPKEEKRVERTRNKLMKEILIEIANKLHNTPTVSKKSYLDNNLVEIYMNDPSYFWRKISNASKRDLTDILIDFLSKNCPTDKNNKTTHTKHKKQTGGWLTYINKFLY